MAKEIFRVLMILGAVSLKLCIKLFEGLIGLFEWLLAVIERKTA